MPVIPIPCLADNYAYLLVCPETNDAALIDPSETGPVLDAVAREKVRVMAILCTHHHHDHVGCNHEVAHALDIHRIYGHLSDGGRIPDQSHFVSDGDRVVIGKISVSVLHVPGHTTGSIAYFATVDGEPVVFTGDTLFVAGSGRLFEGSPAIMHRSLQKLAQLGGPTRIFCGHEYTESNLRFAAHIEPSNQAIVEARARAARLRKDKMLTVPSTMEDELRYNPFLRTSSVEIRSALNLPSSASAEEVFGAVRNAKNDFH
ncbi:MAG: hydroxyacylglutathione hydrolase [Polyangiaceae bacterium]|nr:hydroxyacylglutathione hydrolase [Polyangiaceae bacterium]